jgi:hypothetical protein
MTFPTGAINTTNVDAGTDSPAAARPDILDALQKLNLIIANGEPVTLAGTQSISGAKTFVTPPGGVPGRLIGVQVFTTSGTYTSTAGTGFVVVECQAGGGGGAAAVSTSGNACAGAGGGGGGYVKALLTLAEVNAFGRAVSVGVGGTGGTTAGVAATNGGDTRFGASGPGATGGTRGQTASAATSGVSVAGGGGAAGYLAGIVIERVAGGIGVPGWWTSAGFAMPGVGGDAAKANMGSGLPISGVAGTTVSYQGTGYGFGGGGAAALGANSYAGSNGASGIVIVWEFSS